MKKFLLFAIVILIIQSCGQQVKTDPLIALRKSAEKSICDDVRSLSHSSIDAVSLGFGSLIVKSVMTESEQDSVIMKPFLPVLRLELKKLNKNELENISKNKKDRYQFIGKVLINNKEKITAEAKEKYEYAAPLIDKAIELAQELSKQP
jgi:predicted transport protein